MIFRFSPVAIRAALAALDPHRDAATIRRLRAGLKRGRGEPTVPVQLTGQAELTRVLAAHERAVLGRAGGRPSSDTTDRGTGYDG